MYIWKRKKIDCKLKTYIRTDSQNIKKAKSVKPCKISQGKDYYLYKNAQTGKNRQKVINDVVKKYKNDESNLSC